MAINPVDTSGGGGPSGADFLAEAKKFLGDPYVYGGAGPTTFDCSGLVQYALEQVGLSGVPRTSEEQWSWVNEIGRSDLQPGDLVFSQWPGDDASPGHVAIYAGDDQLLEAPRPGESIHITPLNSYYERFVVGYGRVPGLGSGAAAAGGGSGGGGAGGTPVSLGSDIGGWFGQLIGSTAASPVAGLAGVLGSVLTPISNVFTDADKALTQAMHAVLWLVNPMNWVRIICGILGAAALLAGIVLLYQAT